MQARINDIDVHYEIMGQGPWLTLRLHLQLLAQRSELKLDEAANAGLRQAHAPGQALQQLHAHLGLQIAHAPCGSVESVIVEGGDATT